MYLGIEIGGTKLQMGVGKGDGSAPVAIERTKVDVARQATGILDWIEQTGQALREKHRIEAVGIGFGGPVNPAEGLVIKSHHVEGWSQFALGEWVTSRLKLPAALGNDADVAGLAEARFGAGRDANPVFYVTIGTGIGGGLIVDGKIYRGSGCGAAELGHLRPGLHAERPDQNIEEVSAGWGIAASAQARLFDPISHKLTPWMTGGRPLSAEDVRDRLIEEEEADARHVADLWQRCDGKPEGLTTERVVAAAGEGNVIAQDVLSHAWQALGWGLAQMITLVAPARIVIGGGVSLAGEKLLFAPLRRQVSRYVFPPFKGTYQIVPAELGETVVVHGALALAADEAAKR